MSPSSVYQELPKKNPKRILFIDVARGIAIAAIILGHFGIMAVERVVFPFHVAIFFVISGWFISEKQSLGQFVKKRIHTLLIPYVVTSLVIMVCSFLYQSFTWTVADGIWWISEWAKAALYGSGVFLFRPITVFPIGAIWFLWASFWAGLFLKLSFQFRPLIRLLFILLLFLIGWQSYYWLNETWLPLSIQAGLCDTLFMYFGWLARKLLPYARNLSKEAKALGLIICIVVYLSFIDQYVGFKLVFNQFARGAVDIVGCLCAVVVVLALSRWISSHLKVLSAWLAFIGNYSIIMLCLHCIELDLIDPVPLVPQILFSFLPYNWILLLIGILKIVLLSVICWLLSRSRIILRLFGLKKSV